MVSLTFVEPDGAEVVVDAAVGDTLLDVAHDNEIEIEGACGGECACSTCHVILEQSFYDELDEPDEEEEDMLDLALGLTDTSRLGCQIEVTEAMEGMRIVLPEECDNFLSA
jgi:ferredoxin